MGNCCLRLRSKFGNKNAKIFLVGQDAAGKTTALFMLKFGQVFATVPTIGFNIETVEHDETNYSFWDFGGGDKIRPLWVQYYNDGDVIIFMLDSSDRDRISDSKLELRGYLSDNKFKNAIVLVLANKQDLENVMKAEEIAQIMDIDKYKDRSIRVLGTCATSGEGLREGLAWIHRELAKQKEERATLKQDSKASLLKGER